MARGKERQDKQRQQLMRQWQRRDERKGNSFPGIDVVETILHVRPDQRCSFPNKHCQHLGVSLSRQGRRLVQDGLVGRSWGRGDRGLLSAFLPQPGA